MQGSTESLYINLDRAQEEGKKDLSILKNPFRLEVKKTEVVVSYRVYYRGVSLVYNNIIYQIILT